MKNRRTTFISCLFGSVRDIDALQNIWIRLSKVFTLNVKFLLLSGVMILSLPGLLYAQTPGKHEHDGFLFRFQWGIGGGSLERELKELRLGTQEISGATGSMTSLQLGGAINPNWAIHGGFTYVSMSGDFKGPVSVNNTLADAEASAEYTTLMLTLAVSYYIMPINIYISPEIHFAGTGTIEYGAVTANIGSRSQIVGSLGDIDLEGGTGFGLTIGKEWWVSPDWGLGVALFYYQDTFDIETLDDGIDCVLDCEFDSTHFGIAFSATYN